MTPSLDDAVYLDHHATTPVDERVADDMKPYLTESFGNPASDDHLYGAKAKEGVEEAREKISEALNCRKEEIIFTSGATESDNLAIKGVADYAERKDKGNHIITGETEHEAILEACEVLEERGFDITYLPVDENGLIDPDDIVDAIRDDTLLISIMAANNEIGTIAPLKEIGEIAKDNEVFFHTDAVQAIGYVPIDVEEMGIDLMSISAHKIYGPKGVGALYVRRRNPKVKLDPLIHGGGHERGWRSGTLNVPSIVGLGKAVQLADKEMEERRQHVDELTSYMWDRFDSELDDVVLNGHPEKRIPNNLNVSFFGVENKALVQNLQPELAVSAGSACTTGKVEASHVLQALGGNEDLWHSAVRFGLGKDNTREEIESATDKVIQSVSRLRKLQIS
ncbi:aminotransferase class V-fold PLP-dependent enzyme [Natronorubrum sp. JWXQ-INN-674]|uniref:cysteine desulfurase n=1 Tax=Natronorubrum halalkaliphilum TaxID=2691917 RepID=A0A6B0VRG1_9EURY|nr:cysteine desulfurase family protein [Natronorubrum halalkaliphilum]MXV64441.1 aminotransferase class V-fold PLP-dependent enzyme [Natronorubrum halalkaliphilum]